MHTRFYLLLVSAIFFLSGQAFAKTIDVDCDNGETIKSALNDNDDDDDDDNDANNLTIDFEGTCTEDVEIRRGNVKLRGNGGTLEGSIVISASRSNSKPPGAGRVRLRNFTIDATGKSQGLVVGPNAVVDAKNLFVTQSLDVGVFVYSGGWLRCTDCDSSYNIGDGIVARDNAIIEFSGNVTISNNGGSGLFAINSASISDRNNDDAGVLPATLTATGNTGNGIAIIAGASMLNDGPVISNNNGGDGISVSQGASWRTNSDVTANGNSGFGISVFAGTANIFSGFSGTVTATGNGFAGLLVFEGGILRVIATATITGNGEGAHVFGGLLRVLSGTLTSNTGDDVRLEFGAKARFSGLVTVGTISCDGTAITNGPIVCP